jgi:hypothetical protein
MKTYQFTCCVRIEETGDLMPIYGLVTPPVTAATPTEAMNHPGVIRFCNENNCRIYEMIRR